MLITDCPRSTNITMSKGWRTPPLHQLDVATSIGSSCIPGFNRRKTHNVVPKMLTTITNLYYAVMHEEGGKATEIKQTREQKQNGRIVLELPTLCRTCDSGRATSGAQDLPPHNLFSACSGSRAVLSISFCRASTWPGCPKNVAPFWWPFMEWRAF